MSWGCLQQPHPGFRSLVMLLLYRKGFVGLVLASVHVNKSSKL